MKKLLIPAIAALCFFCLQGCRESTEKQLQKILNSIEIPAEVTGNIDLRESYTVGGATARAEWHSTDSGVITNTGEVKVEVYDRHAILQVKLFIGEHFVTKNFPVTVKGSADLALLHAFVQDQLRFEREVTGNLPLLTEYVQDGVKIDAVWFSDKPEIIAPDGTVRRGEEEVDVTLTVTLSLNEARLTQSFNLTVLRDPALSPINWWHTVEVWTGVIPGEAKKPATPACFPGAVYRKVVSSRDYWLGIEAVVTLPEFTPDPRRFDESKLSYYLDNASIYMGGNAQYESDIGLTWSIGYAERGATNYSRSGIAFRPFWRYITRKEPDCTNCYRNSNVKDLEYYYFPGDKIRMSVISPERGYLQMRIELLEETTIEKYAARRAALELPAGYSRVFMTPPFPSEGMGATKAEFKRVNAIDQVANEGKPTINTDAKVEGAVWHEVYLYREIDDKIYKVPLTADRSAGMACPAGKNQNGDFTGAVITGVAGVNPALGGETVTIKPDNGTGRLYSNYAFIKRKEEDL
ncbi:MAG: immunoglobulin-like domain-containing protein [Bacilli bacterium]|jgi:hypothetical protein|nr:hypothetical protein [Bacillota bacterium]NLM31749.1 hypothetical protein [Acholeplasmataceae bacterium]HOA78014.1 hypothetical protein [Bacilli bacterium]HPZ26821.1 hypothetical protein [Bacilli bacterium]HQC89122.1 hypothetical protein [Bacilli bacterium]